MSGHPIASWLAFGGVIVVLLGIELGVLSRRHAISMRQSAWWSGVVIGIAALFSVALLVIEGRAPALQFATGYVVEFSLSVDNLLVFIIILRYFAVPRRLQPAVLKWGILGAIVMRAIMIAAGTIVLNELHWVIYLLGALLIVTGVRLLKQAGTETIQLAHNPVLRLARRFLPMSDHFAGKAFWVRRGTSLVATPLLLVVLVIEWTDLMFATDSIPAIFAITRDPFLVYTSNILAIMGLRALFFVLAAVIERFAYLRWGVAAVLVLVGAKMIAGRWVVVPTGWSLAGIVVVLGISIAASLWRTSERR